MNWIEEKNKLFNDVYLPLFIEGEYWYDLGKTFSFAPGSQIGSKRVSESSFYGASTGKQVTTLERISERHIKSTVQEFDVYKNLVSQRESVYLDTDKRYNTKDLDGIRKQLTEDIAKVFAFIKELDDINDFERKDTQGIISDELKKRIVELRVIR